MADHLATGKHGEELAAEFLQRKGYRMLYRNWRSGHAEIDLICEKSQWLVFVEVKARSTEAFGYPEEAVTAAKQAHLIKAANQFLQQHDTELEPRFDIISILYKGRNSKIYHIQDAFTP